MMRILRLLYYMRRYWWQSLAAVFLMAVVGLLDAFRVLLVQPIFDHVLHPAGISPPIALYKIPGTSYQFTLQQVTPHFIHNVWGVVAFALVVSTLLKSVCDYAGTYLVNYAGFGMITDLRNDLYYAVLRRSVGFFQKHTTGTLLSTLINDIEKVQFAMSTVLSDFLQQFFTLIFTAIAVVIVGGKLAWVLLLFLPVVVLSARRIGRGVRVTTRKGQDKLAEIQNILHETITGNRIVKAFGMELWEMDRFRRAARRLFDANLKSVKVQAISSPLMDLIASVAIALLLYLGRISIQHQQMTAGSFITFLIAVFTLYDPVRKFAAFYNSFQQALGASEEIFKFMDATDDVQEKKRAFVLKGFKEGIRFEDVGFAYESDGETKQVLHGINLTVQPGEVIALVGPSGAGKSSLVNLIPRFFDVNEGRILIDGHEDRDVTIASLR